MDIVFGLLVIGIDGGIIGFTAGNATSASMAATGAAFSARGNKKGLGAEMLESGHVLYSARSRMGNSSS